MGIALPGLCPENLTAGGQRQPGVRESVIQRVLRLTTRVLRLLTGILQVRSDLLTTTLHFSSPMTGCRTGNLLRLPTRALGS
ncbi:MAG: hypothetical protein JWP39_2635, partial [Jatrophihabitans sp.]|nr:hypothetical protein [Jatrophihabitans sp.]